MITIFKKIYNQKYNAGYKIVFGKIKTLKLRELGKLKRVESRKSYISPLY